VLGMLRMLHAFMCAHVCLPKVNPRQRLPNGPFNASVMAI